MKYGEAQPDLATFAIHFFKKEVAKALAATICVAKLFDSNPELAGGQGFLVMLPDMLGGAKPMVVANAVVPAAASLQGPGETILSSARPQSPSSYPRCARAWSGGRSSFFVR